MSDYGWQRFVNYCVHHDKWGGPWQPYSSPTLITAQDMVDCRCKRITLNKCPPFRVLEPEDVCFKVRKK